MIKWDKNFSIKNLQLDKQHELIFDIADIAHDLAKKIQNDNINKPEELKEELKKVLLKLFQYAKVHFKEEEKFMENIDFPLIEEHKYSHRVLLERAKNLLNYSNDIFKLSEELSILTKDWVFEHFANEDLWLSNFTSKAIHLKEINYTLEHYIKLKSIKFDLSGEKNYDYICNCPLRIHKVPETIHQELVSRENILRCETCEQILIHLDKFDPKENFEILNQKFESIKEQLNYE
ncbi:hemerythrin domain-containing protein [Campylobacter sp. RM10532]|uniref:hemerythrin domain-containing protein n=1 Tax=Campylobacter molothri TaxID=1032242 RepID=UPI00301C1EBD|nr:hemerythrin domain-containing protein [Campylobacter sp. RM10532]